MKTSWKKTVFSIVAAFGTFGAMIVMQTAELPREDSGYTIFVEPYQAFESSALENDEVSRTSDLSVLQSERENSEETAFYVDPNTAGLTELMKLKGVGEVLAKRILDFRSAGGQFYRIDDLSQVQGIGNSIIESNRERLRIDQVATTAASSASTAGQTASSFSSPSSQTAPSAVSVQTTVSSAFTSSTPKSTEQKTSTEKTTKTTTSSTAKTTASQPETTVTSATTTTTTIVTTTPEMTTTPYQPDFPLDLNSAGEQDLAYLPGIGPYLAWAIVDYRETAGPFYAIEDILKVPGIGEKKLEKMLGYIWVNTAGLPPQTSSVTSTAAATTPEMTTTPIISTTTVPEESTGEITSIDSSETEPTVSETEPPVYPVLDINVASAEEFAQLPGVDLTLGENIVLWRTAICLFVNVRELLYVDGMTESLLADIMPYLTVS